MPKVLFNPSTMKVIVDGEFHSIVEVFTGGTTPAGRPSSMFGILVKRGNFLWRAGKLYWAGPSSSEYGSFIEDQFHKLEEQAREFA